MPFLNFVPWVIIIYNKNDIKGQAVRSCFKPLRKKLKFCFSNLTTNK